MPALCIISSSCLWIDCLLNKSKRIIIEEHLDISEFFQLVMTIPAAMFYLPSKS